MIKSAAKMSVGTLVSRVTGFFRELVYAYFFGASYIMDIWVVASNIPNFFREVLGEKAVEAVFLPVFMRVYEKKGEAAAKRMYHFFMIAFTLALILVFVTMLVFIDKIILIFAPGLPDTYLEKAVSMTRISLSYMYLIGFASVFGAILLAFKKFWGYSLSPAISNVVHVAAIVLLYSKFEENSLPLAFLFCGFAMLLTNVILVGTDKRAAFLFKKQPAAEVDLTQEKKTILSQVAPISMEMVFNRLSTIVDKRLASFLAEGAISALYFSFRLIQLPFALIALAVNRVALVELSQSHNKKDFEKMDVILKKGVMLNAFTISPIVCILFIFSKEIISVIYMRGSFTAHDAYLVSYTFRFYLIGLLSMALTSLTSRFLYVISKAKVAMVTSIISLIINVIANFLLFRTALGSGGIALATSVAFTVNFILNFIFCAKWFYKSGHKIKIMNYLNVLAFLVVLIGLCLSVFYVLESYFNINSVAAGVFALLSVWGTFATGLFLRGFLKKGSL